MNTNTRFKITGLATIIVLTLLAFIFSIMYGIVQIPLRSVVAAFYVFDGSREHLIIQTVRLPRAVIAAVVGSSLAVAGCLMQAISRNALAGPELFGINYGAALTAVLASFWLGTTSLQLFAWSALLGAAVAGVLVFLLSSTGRQPLSSVKLVLAGATLNLLFASLTQGILILNEQSLDTMRFWLAGSLTGRDLDLFIQILPYLIPGFICAFALSGQLNIFGLGDEVAQGLGQRMKMIRIICIIAIVLLAGSAVALAGPIGFIGLAVPHIARSITGSDYRWVVPYAAVLGALLLLTADIGARFVLPGQEIPVGVVTAFFGAPFLIYLAQRKERSI
ncbi:MULTISPECIES: FecCD family ABC transporter permease [Paenibacillus]|uniref:Iron complex transport system permease protein n=1 Tax=Paenibacillus pabuli TaxID=1472 RepID=A0A855XPQ5_9BACL|nr:MULTISPECIES: iron ABC transporter permease [Paenibacillus]PWW36577.1 iron complex transport system permease protein [Paenibacillus pabuli]PXW04316.1 iron complex transport system permease protein [Paenibacillus taichungensis]